MMLVIGLCRLVMEAMAVEWCSMVFPGVSGHCPLLVRC